MKCNRGGKNKRDKIKYLYLKKGRKNNRLHLYGQLSFCIYITLKYEYVGWIGCFEIGLRLETSAPLSWLTWYKPQNNSKWKPATKQLPPHQKFKEFKPRSGRNNQWQVQVWNSQSTTWAHNCKAEKRNKKKRKKNKPDEPTEKTKGRSTSLKRTGGKNPRTLDSFGRPEQKLSDEKQKTA